MANELNAKPPTFAATVAAAAKRNQRQQHEVNNAHPPSVQPTSLISNEDLVVIAASPFGPTGPIGIFGGGGGTTTTTNNSTSGGGGGGGGSNGNNGVVTAGSGGGRQRNGTATGTHPPPLCTSDSLASIQIATTPVSVSERVPMTFSGQAETGSSMGAAPAPATRVEIIRRHCLNERVRKTACGLLVTAGIATSWVGATHFIKRTYLYRQGEPGGNVSIYVMKTSFKDPVYHAPFFTTWFCTVWTGLFFPLYLIARTLCRSQKVSLKSLYKENVRTFREKGFTASKFLTRSALFCLLWVATHYMYIYALRILDATDVVALYSSNVSFIYLLSWVILHEQFVGVRIVAVILCNTGIALLAYMDGLTKTPTLGGVILGAAASAGSAVFRVLFKKFTGDANFNQVATFFTVISLVNTLLLWPMVVTLYFTRLEIMTWNRIPWLDLVGAAGLSLVTNLLGNFGIAVTYELFITLGFIVAVPMSAALDIELYNVQFAGMKLSGLILIVVGFMLVLFPENWPDFLTKLIRLRRRRNSAAEEAPRPEVTTSSRSRLRSPSGLIR